MPPVRLTDDCPGSNCPHVYKRADGSLLIRAYDQVDPTDLAAIGPLPAGERLLYVPPEHADRVAAAFTSGRSGC